MILAVTSGDPAADSNHAVCSHLNSGSQLHLFGVDAVRDNLVAALQQYPAMSTFLVGHGSDASFLGSNGIAAVDVSDAAVFATRKCFTLACRTGSIFGSSVATAGGLWCGFVGAISCLPSEGDIIGLFRLIPQFVIERLDTIVDAATASVFIAELEALLSHIEDTLDLAGIASMSAYLAVNNYRERLRIWLPGSQLPTQSSRATSPSIF